MTGERRVVVGARGEHLQHALVLVAERELDEQHPRQVGRAGVDRAEVHLRVLELLAQTAQKSEDWARSLTLAQQILREDPFREDVHCHLMRAHAAQGNRVAVKEQYETLSALLLRELGVEPGQETQRVYRESVK